MTRFENDWERKLDQGLKSLGDARAPRSLLPRVMAAAEAQARQPVWLRKWYALPIWGRAAIVAAASAGALLVLRYEALVVAKLWAEAAGPWGAVAGALSKAAAGAINAAASFWWAWRLPLATAAMASFTACAAAVAFVVALSKASSRPLAGHGVA